MKSHKNFAPLVQALQTALWVTIIFFIVQGGTSTAEASVAGELPPASSIATPIAIRQLLTCERSIAWCWMVVVDPGLACTAQKLLQQTGRTFRAIARVVPNLPWSYDKAPWIPAKTMACAADRS